MKSFLLVVAPACVPQPWQQTALWERRSCRTKAFKAVLRIFSTLMSHVSSLHPYFIASLHCLSFLLPHPEQVGPEVWFFCPWPSYSSWMMQQLSTTSVFPPRWFCLLFPMFLVLFLLLYLVMPVSIPLWLAVILLSFFVSFSLSFPHHFLSDEENGCTFMCFP